MFAFTGPALAQTTSGDKGPEVAIEREELIESELPKTQYNYELDISLRPKAADILKEDFIRAPIRIKYGITDNWQASIEPLTYFDNFFKGHLGLYMTDVTLSTKYNLGTPLGGGVNMAFSFRTVLPVRYDTRISDGYYHYIPTLLFSKQLKKIHLQSSMSVGVNIAQGSGPAFSIRPNDTLSTSVGLTYPSDRITYTTEVAYITDRTYGGSMEEAYLTPGLFLDVHDWFRNVPGVWTFGTGVRIGMLDAPEDLELILRLKLHIRFDYKFDIKEMRFKNNA